MVRRHTFNRVSSCSPLAVVRQVHTLEGHNDFVISVSFSSDGKFIVSGSFDGVVNPTTQS